MNSVHELTGRSLHQIHRAHRALCFGSPSERPGSDGGTKEGAIAPSQLCAPQGAGGPLHSHVLHNAAGGRFLPLLKGTAWTLLGYHKVSRAAESDRTHTVIQENAKIEVKCVEPKVIDKIGNAKVENEEIAKVDNIVEANEMLRSQSSKSNVASRQNSK